ncbi:prepilin-type N-terminal cleavage/methylation domain-containing protein [Microbacterium esteraromaticum]|uniref:Prepilin-type N-terminal cleavage/methylation domain-containing protein n=1 Tax=Microbacterium esteraromaticum TaxID=57043 RepID=A0A7D7WBN7_9MICO|nr:prepilin-type N-terminal cleavage/methylation domain-containing protein [Microbacterium esteraromaticum]QMU96537.1 prepilin-type N-terminal cleavage/methylation domain-containing protein [Microbacterium esteraromaticum]
MRTIRRLVEAKKAEREENGEAGFSLIELIIVVVILGILVAIAIPIIGNIQNEAKISAAKSAAQNAAVQASSQWASGAAAVAADSYKTNDDDLEVTIAGTDANTVCATAVNLTITGANTFYAGPGCASTTPTTTAGS